jgi:hypothetical protein
LVSEFQRMRWRTGPPNQPFHPDVLPFGWLWHGEPDAVSNAIRYAEHYSRSHNAVIRVYDSYWAT